MNNPMTKDVAARYQRFCLGLIVFFAAASLMSKGIDAHYDLSAGTARLYANIGLVVSGAGYFFFRKKAQ